MRSKSSIINIIVNIGSQLLNLLVGLVCRAVFIWTLGNAYLGVSSLFGNILTLLSLAEMGFGSAIIFSMYKPLAEHDHRKIGALMALYKKVYQTIGFGVAAAGLALVPFYRVFMKNPPEIPNLTVIYLLYILNTVVTYFVSYKQNIIIADQKNYICTLYQYTFCIAQNIVQIVILFMTHNFILYLGTQIVFSFLTNYFLGRKAEKMYPYIKTYRREKLGRSDHAAISKNIRALFLHRFGAVVVNGTDILVMSSFVSVASVGIYSQYFLISNTLRNLTGQIFGGITASVGNLGAVSDRRKSYDVYLAANFAGFWMFSFCFISLLCLFNPFIVLWLRRDNLLFAMPVVLLISLNFYTTGMRQATLTFKDAFGLFWYDRYKAVAEAVFNLILSILLTQRFGIIGVFAGTLISTLAIDLWVEPLVLFKHGFHRPVRAYFIRYALYGALAAAMAALTWFACAAVPGAGFWNFTAKCFICLLLPNTLYLALFWHTKEFQYLKSFVRLPKLRGDKGSKQT
ncbi:lipopolysaccharide biosynthesis protein [Faecalispora jeddahensis]|uniref:lipopolysaccharide biosynthesis protein n=1 Tax=Faecalispora jeddahensis TaxID=1414721 RepID=UPI0028AAC6B1|nr:hypothetical protein [Faecalispora jeddahensis]